MATLLTDINLTTSAAVFLADRFTEAGWKIYWQSRDVFSGTGNQGEVTIVSEFPDEPNLLVLSASERTTHEVVIPAFSVHIDPPIEEFRAGLGDAELFQRSSVIIDGFAGNKSQYLSFSTMMRDWFRDGTVLPVRDFESNPNDPSLIDADVIFENRELIREELFGNDVPPQVRYYISMKIDLVFVD